MISGQSPVLCKCKVRSLCTGIEKGLSVLRNGGTYEKVICNFGTFDGGMPDSL